MAIELGPAHAVVLEAIGDRGQIRLGELLEDLNLNEDQAAPPLLELCQRGEISLLAMNDHVVIRRED